MLTVDLERSFLNHLGATITGEPRIHFPGEVFSPERAKGEWIEPRLVQIVRHPRSRSGAERDVALFEVRCFVKVQQKGGRRLELSALVDRVRAVVDTTLGAAAAIIYDQTEPTPVGIGMILFGAAQETRTYGVSITVDGVDVPGLDLATLSVEAQITGDP